MKIEIGLFEDFGEVGFGVTQAKGEDENGEFHIVMLDLIFFYINFIRYT